MRWREGGKSVGRGCRKAHCENQAYAGSRGGFALHGIVAGTNALTMEPRAKKTLRLARLARFLESSFHPSWHGPGHRPIKGRERCRLNRQLPQFQGWLAELPQLPRLVVLLNAQLRASVFSLAGSLVVFLVAWSLLTWASAGPKIQVQALGLEPDSVQHKIYSV